MKVIMEFDTSEENFDRNELEMHKQSFEMMVALSRIVEQLNSWEKWGYTESKKVFAKDENGNYKKDSKGRRIKEWKQETVYKIPVDVIKEELWDIIQDAGVSMEKMGY